MQTELNEIPAVETPEPKKLGSEIPAPKEKKDAKKNAADDCCAPVCGPTTCG